MPAEHGGRAERDTLRPSAAWSASRTGSLLPPGEPCRLALEVLCGPDQGLRVTSDSLPLSIGSAPGNDLRLSDPHVSRIHCRMLKEDDGSVLLRDEQSRNGTFVRGVKIFQVALDPGTEIQVGRTRIRFGFAVQEDAGGEVKLDRFGELIGASHTIRNAFEALRRVAPTALTCLLLGETGTGKELAARAIHDQSPRASGPFIVIDCGAVTETLIEDKLFGHERGAFTGALREAQGAFEEAKGGTIFLDEVGELPLALQPKLLRVLERREIVRLGSHKAIPIDVRVIAATHRDLHALAVEGRFRQDLYYRLAEASVRLPPLRNRMDDIDFLARHLLDGASGAPVLLQPDALAALKAHRWPGNVRELRNVLRRAAATASGGAIDAGLLEGVMGPAKTGFPDAPETTATFDSLPIAEARDAHRKAYLKQLLERHGDDHAAIAQQMGVHIKYARRLMRRYGFIR
jgi:two-component system, NtrC family, response regulator GlrR